MSIGAFGATNRPVLQIGSIYLGYYAVSLENVKLLLKIQTQRLTCTN